MHSRSSAIRFHLLPVILFLRLASLSSMPHSPAVRLAEGRRAITQNQPDRNGRVPFIIARRAVPAMAQPRRIIPSLLPSLVHAVRLES